MILARVASHSLVYGLGNVATALLAIFLIPLYTHRLTPAEFGVYSLVMMVHSVLSALTDAGLTSGVARYYYEGAATESSDQTASYRARLVSTATVSSLAIAGLVAGACYVSADFLAESVLGSRSYGALFEILAAILLFRGLTTTPMIYLRLAERPFAYAWLVFLQMTLFLGLNAVFVLVLRKGVVGILYSHLWSTLAWGIAAAFAMRSELRVLPQLRIALRLLSFGLPFLPVLLLSWVVDLSDRYILGIYLSTADVGIYSLGYRLGQAMTLLVTAFTLAWGPLRFKVLTDPAPQTTYARIATLYLVGAGGVWLALVLFAEQLVALIAPGAFQGSAVFVAPVAFGYLIYGLFVVSVTGMGVAKQTRDLPAVAALAAVANVALNLWLVPRMGAIAAAYTTVLAYAIMTCGALLASQRLYPIPYDYPKWGLLLCSMTGLAWLARLLAGPAAAWSPVVGLLALATYGGIALFSGALTRQEVRVVGDAVAGLFGRPAASDAQGA